eukprot:jgi/Botrbrau1/12015/Bobra.247_2s0020.1
MRTIALGLGDDISCKADRRRSCRLIGPKSSLAILTLIVLSFCPVAQLLSRSPYDVLRVTRQATDAEIKKAYRKLSKSYHPDKTRAQGATEKLLEVQEAYEILSDPEKKREYDHGGNNARAHPQGGGNFYYSFHEEAAYQAPPKISSITARVHRYNLQQFVLRSPYPWLLQVYADFSGACRRFAPEWGRRCEGAGGHCQVRPRGFGLGPQLRMDSSWGGRQPSAGIAPVASRAALRHWLAPNCESLSCAVRFSGKLRSDALQLFAADVLLHLPQVHTYDSSKLDRVLGSAPASKVVMLALDSSGSRPPSSCAA